MNTRSEALVEAIKIIDEIAPRTNASGFTDGTMPPAERITEALRVAEWLLDNHPAEAGHACSDCGRTTGDIVHINGDKWRHAYGYCTTDGAL